MTWTNCLMEQILCAVDCGEFDSKRIVCLSLHASYARYARSATHAVHELVNGRITVGLEFPPRRMGVLQFLSPQDRC